jgi:hypothetical protein
MRTWLIVTLLFCAGSTALAQVWTWTDETGQVHYSDRPVPGAREIELSHAQSIPMPRAEPAVTASGQAATDASQRYTLRIASPEEEETLWNTGGTLTVEVQLAPQLQPGHQVDVVLNGERRNLARRTTRFTLEEVWRGEHTLQAVIVDQADRELQRSPAVTFFVQQTSVQNPFNPNVPRLAPPQNIPGR